jgi:NAD(P)-dependent dehydrogenase (short-subunit alcohol dehydrogenase family)
VARVLITGSADGLGRPAAQTLIEDGHEVVVHARSRDRLMDVQALIDRGAESVIGDLADIARTHAVARQVNELGAMDAVIHNAGVMSVPSVLALNVIAPYLLTTPIARPHRLIYLSSGMHRGGRPRFDGADWSGRRATGSYSDTRTTPPRGPRLRKHPTTLSRWTSSPATRS